MSTKVTEIEREEHATDQLFLLVVASSAAHVTWVVTASVLAYAIGVPLYGVRSLLIIGWLGFASGGILCAVAPSLVVLVGDCLETHRRGAFWTEPETGDRSPRSGRRVREVQIALV